jgi:2,3-bisphosphoglycerate-independent phosphoglycerate mutase
MVVLVVLDGWGYRTETAHNAIAAAVKPTWDRWWNKQPHTLIQGSARFVGLPEGQMGNSEVGHMNLGAGRVVYQDSMRIFKAIEDGSFFRNEALQKACHSGGTLHVMGLLSPGGVHSHEQHIHAMMRLAHQQGVQGLQFHAFLDGRDTPPRSALDSIAALEQVMAELGVGRIASVVGRYYAMDRDKRWDRTERAYRLVVQGDAPFKTRSAREAVEQGYGRGENDEFIQPTVVLDAAGQVATMADGDAVVFMNFRADRARQLTEALVSESFGAFARPSWPRLSMMVTLTLYRKDLPVAVAFPPVALTEVLGAVLAEHGVHQLRLAETEKYAHVTYFFNGGREDPFPLEERQLIPSPKVATYDLKPEMSALQVAERLVQAVRSREFGFILCNFANADMVGHTGNFEATKKAIEVLDHCLGMLDAALAEVHGEALITADHGNAELMWDEETGQAHTAHTTNPVPFMYVGERKVQMEKSGALCDVAPTVLHLLGFAQPTEMTGRRLLTLVS